MHRLLAFSAKVAAGDMDGAEDIANMAATIFRFLCGIESNGGVFQDTSVKIRTPALEALLDFAALELLAATPHRHRFGMWACRILGGRASPLTSREHFMSWRASDGSANLNDQPDGAPRSRQGQDWTPRPRRQGWWISTERIAEYRLYAPSLTTSSEIIEELRLLSSEAQDEDNAEKEDGDGLAQHERRCLERRIAQLQEKLSAVQVS